MKAFRKILLSAITTLILVSQVLQLLVFEDKWFVMLSFITVFILSFIFLDDVISLLKLKKK